VCSSDLKIRLFDSVRLLPSYIETTESTVQNVQEKINRKPVKEGTLTFFRHMTIFRKLFEPIPVMKYLFDGHIQ